METVASDIMSNEVLTATESTTLEDVLKTMINNRITGMPVIDSEGKMIGVISESDILAQLSGKELLHPEVFQEPIVFNRQIKCIRDETSLEEIMDIFINTRVRRLPAVDSVGHLIGIVSKRDLMRLFYYRAKLL
mgnify:CR=1 FL=1